jgi:alginate O-acetyltransferase complex protein AlgI
MTFTSFSFIAFVGVVLAGLRLAPGRSVRQWLLLLASLWFYASWKPAYLLVLATPILVDYFCAIRIEQNADAAVRKCWLAIGVCSNLVLLAYFKYANFLFESVLSASLRD